MAPDDRPQDEAARAAAAKAAARALQSGRPPQASQRTPVADWLIDAFVVARGTSSSDAALDRAELAEEFLLGVQDAAVGVADAHGYGALSALTARRQARLEDLRTEYTGAVRREVERDALPFIAGLAAGQDDDVFVVAEHLIGGEDAKLVEVVETFEFDEDQQGETSRVAGLAVVTLTDGGEGWRADYPGHAERGPVPVGEWARAWASSDPAFDPSSWSDDDLAGSLDRFARRAAKRRDALAREISSLEVEVAVAVRVVDQYVPLAPSGLAGPRAVEVDALRLQHRRALLQSHTLFLLAAVAELRRAGRATSVKAAFEALTRECAEGPGREVRLAYASAEAAENALRNRRADPAACEEFGYEAVFRSDSPDDPERQALDGLLDLLRTG